MNKSDLRTGMMVRNREGNEFTVDKEVNRITSKSGGDSLGYYNDDLTNQYHRDLDIVEVIGTIWQRKPEPKRMTVTELIESHKKHTGEDVEVVQEVREVTRKAATDEYIIAIVDDDRFGRFKKGDIFKVVRQAGGSFPDGAVCYPLSDFDSYVIYPEQYRVLEGYQPEASHE